MASPPRQHNRSSALHLAAEYNFLRLSPCSARVRHELNDIHYANNRSSQLFRPSTAVPTLKVSRIASGAALFPCTASRVNLPRNPLSLRARADRSAIQGVRRRQRRQLSLLSTTCRTTQAGDIRGAELDGCPTKGEAKVFWRCKQRKCWRASRILIIQMTSSSKSSANWINDSAFEMLPVEAPARSENSSRFGYWWVKLCKIIV